MRVCPGSIHSFWHNCILVLERKKHTISLQFFRIMEIMIL